MPGYTHKGKRTVMNSPAGSIDQGAVASPKRHDRPEENTMAGTPKPMDKPEGQYIVSESVPSMDRHSNDVPPMDNPGSYAKKFS